MDQGGQRPRRTRGRQCGREAHQDTNVHPLDIGQSEALSFHWFYRWERFLALLCHRKRGNRPELGTGRKQGDGAREDTRVRNEDTRFVAKSLEMCARSGLSTPRTLSKLDYLHKYDYYTFRRLTKNIIS